MTAPQSPERGEYRKGDIAEVEGRVAVYMPTRWEWLDGTWTAIPLSVGPVLANVFEAARAVAQSPERGEGRLSEHRICNASYGQVACYCSAWQWMTLDEYAEHIEAIVARREREAAERALRPIEALAEAMNAVPDYTATVYDQGCVDQRHMDCGALFGALASGRAASGPTIEGD